MPTPTGFQRAPAQVMSMATRTMVMHTESTDMEVTGTVTGDTVTLTATGTPTAPEDEA